MKANVFRALLIFCSILFTTSLKSQSVATIDGEAISTEEFLYAFNKNRKAEEDVDLDSLEAYLEQFINFKLKVKAAKALGLDTAQAFKDELAGYIDQIKKPYLENPQAEEELLKETYRHMQSDVNASHILIKVAPTAAAEDTLKAYNFLDSLRTTIDSKHEFEELAKKFSQDGSAQLGGNLGWFTAMQMVTPFEDGAYDTPIGQVSEVVRSNFGYHLIYVNDKRPNQGKVRTSHIFFTKQRGNEQAFQRAQMVYDSLENGANWNEMVRKFSDDNGTKTDAGRLPWAGVKQLPDDFLEIAYSIKERDQYTEPKETQFGWHIVRLDDKQPLEPYEIKKGEIALLLKRMGRNTLEEGKLIAKLKSENGFEQNFESLNQALNKLSFTNKIDAEKELKDQTIFQHGNKTVRVSDFLESLPGFKVQYTKSQLADFYQKFEKDFIIAFEDSIAPQKYPEFRFLMKEYKEGLLLFEVMQRKVWNKAAEDSLGLKKYYQSNLNNYQIEERLECLCANPSSNLDQEKLEGIIVPKDSIKDAEAFISKKIGDKKATELKFAKRILLASELANFETEKTLAGSWFEPKNLDAFCLILKEIPAGPQPFEEIKGIVMSDYQEELDRVWIKELRGKAKIKVDKKELKAIIKN